MMVLSCFTSNNYQVKVSNFVRQLYNSLLPNVQRVIDEQLREINIFRLVLHVHLTGIGLSFSCQYMSKGVVNEFNFIIFGSENSHFFLWFIQSTNVNGLISSYMVRAISHFCQSKVIGYVRTEKLSPFRSNIRRQFQMRWKITFTYQFLTRVFTVSYVSIFFDL